MAVSQGYKQSAEHVRKRMQSRVQTLINKPRPVSKTWLKNEYWGKERSCVDIGKDLDKDPKTILSWMKHYGIPSRPRGFNHAQLPKDGSSFRGHHHNQKAREAIREKRILDGGVPYLKDGEHWLKKGGSIHPNWKGGVTPDRQSFYVTDEWRDAVKATWKRAGAKCERCGLHHNDVETRGTFHVHHIVSFAVRELRAEPSNLALLCKSCHLFVHSKKNKDKEFIKGESL